MNLYHTQTKKGFTLIEMIVVVGIFSVVMTIAMGAIFTVVSANKSAQALASVIDNLNSALDTMSRNTRFGTNFQCEADSSGNITRTRQSFCEDTEGSSWFGLVPYEPGMGVNRKVQPLTIYKFVKPAGSTTGSIYRCQAARATDPTFKVNPTVSDGCMLVTAPEVQIEKLSFYVDGTTAGAEQPRIFMLVQGSVPAGTTKQPFYIQTLISQRTLNI